MLGFIKRFIVALGGIVLWLLITALISFGVTSYPLLTTSILAVSIAGLLAWDWE